MEAKVINKKWYLSKTVWVNAVATIAVGLQVAFDKNILSPELQAMLIGGINVFLRTVTKENIVW